jgi:hypothetical protein
MDKLYVQILFTTFQTVVFGPVAMSTSINYITDIFNKITEVSMIELLKGGRI